MAESQHKSKPGFQRIIRAFHYSMDGLRLALNESAFRQELALTCAMLPIAFLVEVTPAERALLVASVLFILVVELLNSAVEAVVDRVSLEDHELSKRAKDLGSAAVLASFVIMGSTWGIILWPIYIS